MKDFADCYGKWALIAGAAEGIGAAFTEALAARKINIILVDIRRTTMEELAARMEKIHGVSTVRLVLDLSQEDSWRICMSTLEDLDCRLMIYIPAYSQVKLFLSSTPAELDKFLDLNCRTLMKLALDFGNRVKNERHSGIILMSSLAGLIGPQYIAPYAATKAFTNIIGEALHQEFRRYNIDVLVCCAGPVSTPSYWSSQPGHKGRGSNVMDPSFVAEFTLKKLGKKAVCVPGWKNRLTYYFLTRLISRKNAASLVNKAMADRYPRFND